MKNFKFKKIKSNRPIKTYIPKRMEIKYLKIPNKIFWNVHKVTPIEFFHKKEESELYFEIKND